MRTYWIGRNGDTLDVRINDRSVSSLHAELVLAKDGKILLTDCASRNGTFQREGGQWRRLQQQTFVTPDDWVRFGERETSIQALLDFIDGAKPRFAAVR